MTTQLHVVCFLLGDSPASEIYMPTFRNTLFHLHRQVGACRMNTHLPAYEDGTECSETSAYKFQTPGNHPKESIQHSVHGESLKSRTQLQLVIIIITIPNNKPDIIIRDNGKGTCNLNLRHPFCVRYNKTGTG